ncbi:hypothetical protein Ddc_05289 [Ditylenchus destructor]|nr:hypothetical protein Ddc_05289 [Ditylenchus destructor]
MFVKAHINPSIGLNGPFPSVDRLACGQIYKSSFVKRRDGLKVREYKPFLTPRQFQRLAAIYTNKSLLVIDKLKELDELFMSLPEDTLVQLPTPRAFRRLPEDIQARVRAVYYNKAIEFEDKLRKLESLVHSLPHEMIKLIPVVHGDELPGLVEFDVPVLLQFNGHVETHLLRKYLTPDDFETFVSIVKKRNMPEVTRARLIGKLLKEAYQKDPVNFPMPLSETDGPDEIRRLGVHLMFSRNPFDNIDPFTKVLEILKGQTSSTEEQKPHIEDALVDPIVERFDSENQNDNVDNNKDGSTNETVLENDEPESERNMSVEYKRKMTKIQQFIRSFKGSIHS